MHIPADLQDAIENEVLHSKELSEATQLLSNAYRTGTGRGFKDHAQRAAYLATRMPATYAAIHGVLTGLRDSSISPTSLLDLGSGPGTASWAASSVFDQLSSITMIEQDTEMLAISSRLAGTANHNALRSANHLARRFPISDHLTSVDLVICSYFLGEMDLSDALLVARNAWEATRQALVVIEPGSQRGFHVIRQIRDALLQQGGFLLAPCPHGDTCPLPETDWCHFGARIERSSLHRRLKKGELSYEDEKFSYVTFVREPKTRAISRVIRRPASGPGFVKLSVCGENGINQETIPRRDKAGFKAARKVQWGDKWPVSTSE